MKQVHLTCLFALLPLISPAATGFQPALEPVPGAPDGVLHAGTMELSFSAGAGIGMPILFSETAHDWALGAIDLGWVFSDEVGGERWYRGNWELVGDLFGGAQFRPDTAYVIGVAPLLRYDFTGAGRLIPFLNAGAGATATGIRNGDLSTTFEYNLQGGGGVHWMISKRWALTAEYRWIHLSNAGMKLPNLGLNTSTFFGGVTRYF